MADQPRHPDRRTSADRRARFEEIKADITARLRGACANMAPAEFETLVCRMARLRLRYELESATCNH